MVQQGILQYGPRVSVNGGLSISQFDEGRATSTLGTSSMSCTRTFYCSKEWCMDTSTWTQRISGNRKPLNFDKVPEVDAEVERNKRELHEPSLAASRVRFPLIKKKQKILFLFLIHKIILLFVTFILIMWHSDFFKFHLKSFI